MECVRIAYGVCKGESVGGRGVGESVGMRERESKSECEVESMVSFLH